MQNGVHGRFLDHSTSVREAAIELVGKFILIRPELTAQYYDMLSERILVGSCYTAPLILLFIVAVLVLRSCKKRRGAVLMSLYDV